MMMRRFGLTAFALLCASAALADPPPATAPAYRPSSGALIPVAIYDAQGNIVGTFGGGGSGGSVTPPGTSGSQAQAVQGIPGGVPLPIQGGNATAVKTDGSAVTQPVSATALPLPTGAATAAAQSTGNTLLSSIDGKVPAPVSGRVPVDGSGVTQPVSAASLPLPSGAATAANQSSEISALNAINSTLTGATPATQAGPSLTPAAALGVVLQDGQTTTVSASSASVLTNATYADGAIPTAGYASLSLAFSAPGSGNLIVFEESNDKVNWYINYQVVTGQNGGNAITNNQVGASNINFRIPLYMAYVRVRAPTFGTGPLSAILTLKTTQPLPVTSYVTTQRLATFTDQTFASVAASASLIGTSRSSAAPYTKFNVWAGCSQSATLIVRGSNDGFATTAQIVASQAIAAGSAVGSGSATAAGTSVTTPTTFTSYRVDIVNGATAGSCTANSSFTAG